MPVPHHNDTVTELPMKSLVVQLLKDLLKVTRKIHCPGRSPRLQAAASSVSCLSKCAEISRRVKADREEGLALAYKLFSNTLLCPSVLSLTQ